MTPGARLQAAIDCLDSIEAGAPAEKTLTNWARLSRFAGSKDRAAVRDFVFSAIRSKDSAAFVGEGATGRAIMLGLCALQGLDATALFGAGGYAPEPLSDAECELWDRRSARVAEAEKLWNLPEDAKDFLQRDHPDHGFDIARKLTTRAPVDLRVNRRKARLSQAQSVLADVGVETDAVAGSASALRVTQGSRSIKQTKPFLEGWIELQDAGSQMLIEHLAQHVVSNPPKRVLDYCAGGGGKSLAMAAHWEADFIAHDIEPARMRDIPERAKRAGVKIAQKTHKELVNAGLFDIVLCDAPCSGSGAWRRSPEAKWRFSTDDLARLNTMQLDVLISAQTYVAKGGILAYATCSLFKDENQRLVERFISENPQWLVKSEFFTTPHRDVDGFYIAVMESGG